MKITARDLEGVIRRLNTVTGQPQEPYSKGSDGKYHPNAGCYHLEQAYGGYRLVQMCSTGSGTSNVTPRGTKAEVYHFIHAYLDGYLRALSHVHSDKQ